MKKLAIALCFATTFAVPTMVLAQGPTWTKSTIEKYNDYDYELWMQNDVGNVSMKLTGDNGSSVGGTFEATWSNTQNVLFRSGRKFTNGNTSGTSGQTHKQIGNISINFAATWSSTDNVKMLGIYGWAFYASGSVPTKQENGTSSTFSNQIEYYIIQDRGSYNSATQGTNSKKYGSATIDGIVYDFYVCDRLNQPMLTGNGNFKQYFSVPQSTSSHRQSGTVSVSKHFEEWEKIGMKMDGPLYEAAMKVESYTGSGSSNGQAKVTKNILTIGGTTTTSSNSTGGTTSSSSGTSTTQSSSSVAKTQATTCKTPLITYPTSTVPSDPYTACFRYASNNKCYVCKVSSEGEYEGNVNTCASAWVWDGTQIASNLENGYWYQEVTCPASSSSTAVSSSSQASSSSAVISSSSRASSSSVAVLSSSSRASSSSVAVLSSSSRASSSSVAVLSSSSRASSSSITVLSSSSRASSSSGNATLSSSSVDAIPSSSSNSEDATPSSSSEDTTPITSHSPYPTPHTPHPTYYSLKGEPIGNAKPQKAGIYIVKQGNSVRKIAVR
ncbi:endo-1,4-beta-xylanase [Fibrobacteria bacterium R8-3-H12]